MYFLLGNSHISTLGILLIEKAILGTQKSFKTVLLIVFPSEFLEIGLMVCTNEILYCEVGGRLKKNPCDFLLKYVAKPQLFFLLNIWHIKNMREHNEVQRFY